MSAHPAHVALIDDTGQIAPSELAGVAADLTTQATRQLGPVWGARAIVSAMSERIRPANYWPIRIRTRLSEPGALGFHSDELNQPVAYIELSADWTITASHELCEMLVDPSGNRLRGALLPDGTHASQFGLSGSPLVRYLLEVSDPCEAASYQVGSTRVSDFLTPSWYEPSPLPQPSVCSHTGLLSRPRQIADGGYVSFARSDDEWFQVFNQSGVLQVSALGKFNSSEARSLREWVDGKAREHRRDST